MDSAELPSDLDAQTSCKILSDGSEYADSKLTVNYGRSTRFILVFGHAEKIAERLWYLGAKPTIQPDPIHVGDTLEEMLKNDVKAEVDTIAMYKEIMQIAEKEGDIATKEIFEEIEEEEEDHHDFFTSLLEK